MLDNLIVAKPNYSHYVRHMADLDVHILETSDGSWDRFRADWESQCTQVGDTFEEYAPDSLSVLTQVATGGGTSLGGTNQTKIGALWDSESARYYACFMLNRAMLPGTQGWTLRVRHLLVSPLLDYGEAPVSLYPDVLIGILAGVVHISSSSMSAEHIRFHLRSPEDQSFFRAIGTSLNGSGVFASVQPHGAWLYIIKAGAA